MISYLISSCQLHDGLMNIVNSQNNGWDVEITGFSSGSIIVNFKVIVFDSDRANLNDQAAAVETSLGLQQPGIWQTADGSVSLDVESIVAFGEFESELWFYFMWMIIIHSVVRGVM